MGSGMPGRRMWRLERKTGTSCVRAWGGGVECFPQQRRERPPARPRPPTSRRAHLLGRLAAVACAFCGLHGAAAAAGLLLAGLVAALAMLVSLALLHLGGARCAMCGGAPHGLERLWGVTCGGARTAFVVGRVGVVARVTSAPREREPARERSARAPLSITAILALRDPSGRSLQSRPSRRRAPACEGWSAWGVRV